MRLRFSISFLHLLALLIACLLAASLTAHGQTCTTATCTALSANESDVLAALPSSGNTNATVTVTIPSGTGTWTTGFNYTIPSAVTSLIIQGATTVSCSGTAGTSTWSCTATDNTIFIDSYVASNVPLMSIHVGTKSFRMTGITFQGGTLATGVTKPNGFLNFDGTSSSFRIDHSHFNTNTYTPVNSGGGMTIFSNLWGVVDHTVCDMYAQNNCVRVYSGQGDFGDANWAAATQFGTVNFVYEESDIFNGGAVNDCDDGGRGVIRYSTINAASSGGDQGLWQTHQMGQGTQRSRGCRALEVYHNYINNPNPSNNLFTAGDGGSGTGLAWANTITSGYKFDIGFQNDRQLATGHSQTAPPNGIGYCGSGSSGVLSAWDGNSDSTTGYPCINQTGRGQGDLLNGQNFPNALNTATGTIAWPHNLREPWYVWNETIAAGSVITNPTWNGVTMLPNRDFYPPASSFNGTTGTGFGLLSARPTACTAGPGGPYDTSPGGGSYGVGYFATDTNTLYVCTQSGSPGTWTAIYTPLTYPHPLAGGTTTFALSTATAGTGSGTITGCAGSYASGASYSCTVTPATGSTLSSVTGCGGSGTTTYTGTMPASNCTVTATFAGTPQAATPVISPAGATYPRSQTVTITDSTPSSTIYYTTNGTTPTTSSTVYSGSFTVSSSSNVQAIATASGFTQSLVGQSIISITSAITIEGGGSAHCATSANSCAVGTAFAGDTIVVEISTLSGTPTPSDGTNTYHLINSGSDPANPEVVYMFVACNVSAGSYTVTMSGVTGSWVNLHAKILANTLASSTCWDTGPITQVQVNTTGSTSLTSGSAQLPTGNNEWIEGYGVPDNDFTTVITAGTNYTLFDCLNLAGGTNKQPACTEFWNQGTATATNHPMTTSTSYDWLDMGTAILPVGGSTPVCGQPYQNGPNYSNTYPAPPYTLPLPVGFTSPTPGCTMHATLDGTTPTCSSATYGGTSSLSATTTIRVIACQTSYTSSAVVGGTWVIVPAGTTVTAGVTLTGGTGVK